MPVIRLWYNGQRLGQRVLRGIGSGGEVTPMPMLIGTSGWQYRDWRGGLYPEGVPQRLWLEHYATRYATVENNNSFYRLPSRETFAAWRERTPDGFVMAVKASRYLTHVRRLRDPAGPVARLLGAAVGLGPKLGPVLLQLPPTLKADPDTLDACLKEFRTAAAALSEHGLRLAVEPRHETWWTDEIRQILTASRSPCSPSSAAAAVRNSFRHASSVSGSAFSVGGSWSRTGPSLGPRPAAAPSSRERKS